MRVACPMSCSTTITAVPDASVQFQVLHEDAHLIVVDKPAGLVVHPARGHASGTLVNGLLARGGFERASADARDPNAAVRPGVVHRIDKDTSGILVVAKDEPTREGLKAQLSNHSMERLYRALTLGVPKAGAIETLTILIGAGANLTIPSAQGSLPLDTARRRGDQAVIRILEGAKKPGA